MTGQYSPIPQQLNITEFFYSFFWVTFHVESVTDTGVALELVSVFDKYTIPIFYKNIQQILVYLSIIYGRRYFS